MRPHTRRGCGSRQLTAECEVMKPASLWLLNQPAGLQPSATPIQSPTTIPGHDTPAQIITNDIVIITDIFAVVFQADPKTLKQTSEINSLYSKTWNGKQNSITLHDQWGQRYCFLDTYWWLF